MANTAEKESFFDVPELAIAAYEAWSGLRVKLHDTEVAWAPFLPDARFFHDDPVCTFTKGEGLEYACMRFEIDELRAYLRLHTEGCTKVCHAGVLEWVVPVLHDGRISAVLFAGLRRTTRRIAADLVDGHSTGVLNPWPRPLPRPKSVTVKQSALYMEGLRQLASRLQVWIGERVEPVDGAVVLGASERPKRRQQIIERFIAQRYQEPVTLDDLARELHLSRSRTAHLVKEVCGRTFVDLLTRFRLRHAAAMLFHTQCSVSDAALNSGFGDLSHFHHVFRKRYSVTPLHFREQGGIR